MITSPPKVPKHPLIVLIGLDPADVAVFQGEALKERGTRTLTARSWLQGMALVRAEPVALVVATPGPDGGDLAALCHGVREAAADAPLTVALVADGPVIDEAKWPWNEAPHVLSRPVLAARAHAVIRLALDQWVAYDALLESQRQLHQIQLAFERHQEEMAALLMRVIELRMPGAGDRAELRRRLCADVCERLNVPAELRRDLDRAAHLLEIGCVATGQPAQDTWRSATSAREVLAPLTGFEGAADMIGNHGENWDGTGAPEHLIQGQIPLRARILRVIADYVAMLEGNNAPTPDTALERIAEHAGTAYDPMVVVHLRALAGAHSDDDWHRTRTILPVDELHVGMVLAEDLYTDSGIKLLAAGTEISPASLETILRRHRSEPLMHGAAVRRKSA